MNLRLLILTAGYGEGHNAAARALATAWEARNGRGQAVVVDVFALAAPRLNELTRRAYLGLINHAPNLWRAAYGWLDRSAAVPQLLRGLQAERKVLSAVIAREDPVAICCTYPVYAFLLRVLAEEEGMAVPFFNVVTDSISINSLWWRAGAAGWFLPNEDSRAALLQAGVDPELVAVSGFPVPPFFADNEGRLTPPDLAAGAVPRVLYIINSGTRGSAETARRLLQETNWEVTCTVGRNAGLQTELSRLAAGRRAPATVLGWTSGIPRLLMTHHVVVSKAGGATTQEALAAGCPMIVNQIVPGQEEGNYELLRRHGVGALAETPDAVLAALQRAFADEGREWRRWRLALRRIAHPTAGPEVVSAILGAMARPAGETDAPFAWPPAAATA
jgi:processive 1,2-diacylglycerol beta-glucosyltransferase